MGTMIYFLNGPFIIMLILGFSFFCSFITLYICLIFLLDKFGKFSLILTMSLLLEAWAYEWPLLVEALDEDILPL